MQHLVSTNFQSLQIALLLGGVVRLEGHFDLAGNTLEVSSPNTKILADGAVLVNGNLSITGSGTTIHGLTMWGQVRINAVMTRLSKMAINALSSSAVVISGGAGLWFSESNINGQSGLGTVGITVNGAFDSLWIRDVLIEEHDSGIRLGSSSGDIANIWMSGVVMDRVSSSGLPIHVEPSGTGRVLNIQAQNLWSSGGISGALLNQTGDSLVHTLQFTNWLVKGTTQQSLWVNGTVSNLYQSQVLFQV